MFGSTKMINMPDLVIDSIQNGKKQFIEKHISNSQMKQAWTEYVDAQTNFLHVAIKTSTVVAHEIMTDLMETRIEKLFNPFSIDWIKASLDAWTTQMNKTSYF